MTADKKEKEYVSLGSLMKMGESITYNNLGKAVESLDDLGLCMNSAILITIDNHPSVVLLYQGWTYRCSFERSVSLPFREEIAEFENGFKELLRKIFQPFVDFASIFSQSLISVIRGQDLHKQECFFITLILHFSDKTGEQAKVIKESLEKVEDSHNDISGRAFWLD